ncbi:carbohydrate ABC transporter permease [Brassicibacter mesophilus]|uniref:carbohydrate ABC transporter permease n=1 Tax=Brassicibacter mesophilus TaxID=745119 RepID=UPI003D243B76
MNLSMKKNNQENVILQKQKSNRISSKRRTDYFWAYLMIFPTVAGLGIFYISAFFKNVFYSFTDLGLFGQYKWIGLENYQKMFSDPKVLQALGNTLKYTIATVPIGISISILVAVLLNSKIKGLTIYRTLYFLPAVTMPTAIAMVWKWLYNNKFGLLNQVLAKIGIEGHAWITDPDTALWAVIVVGIWSGVGFNMIILLAGLQGIPQSYYEAASIDGAGPIRQFFTITLPLLTPTIFFVSIMTLISAFQVFDVIFMMISESSLAIDSTMSMVYLFYKNAFILHNKGYASAIAVLIFCIIMLVTIIQLRLQKKWVNY